MNKITRRDFFKSAITTVSGLALVQLFLSSQATQAIAAGAAPKMSDADKKKCEAALKNLPQYVEKAPDENKTCDKCMFYDHEKKGVPTCQLAQNCHVAPKGTCASFVKKA